jgi:competence protein ComEA
MLKRSTPCIALLVILTTVGLAGGGGQEAGMSVAVADKVNINTADVTTLMTLGGVGRKVAERIVEHRQAQGPFEKPEDVRKVDGVGRSLWERNRARIVVK